MKVKKITIPFIILAAILFNFVVLNNSGLLFFANPNPVVSQPLCEQKEVIDALKIVGSIVRIIQILGPVAIVITGITSGYKLVMTEPDGGAKALTKMIIEKVVICAFLIFIPIIVSAVMKLVSSYDETKFSKCIQCASNVNAC